MKKNEFAIFLFLVDPSPRFRGNWPFRGLKLLPQKINRFFFLSSAFYDFWILILILDVSPLDLMG